MCLQWVEVQCTSSTKEEQSANDRKQNVLVLLLMLQSDQRYSVLVQLSKVMCASNRVCQFAEEGSCAISEQQCNVLVVARISGLQCSELVVSSIGGQQCSVCQQLLVIVQCAIKWRQPSIGACPRLHQQSHFATVLLLHLSSFHVFLNLTVRAKIMYFIQVCILPFVCLYSLLFVFVEFCISLARWAAHPRVWGQLLQEMRVGEPCVGFD